MLAVTGSPAKAGIVGFAGALPLLVLTLPAGALVDRWNRKRVMIAADVVRCLALGSLAAAIALDHVWLTHVAAVAVADGCGYVFFSVGERSALPSVVPDHQLSAALARNQGREYAALLAGQPLGGTLFAAGRIVPFLVDAVSYAVSVLTLLLVRSRFQAAAPEPSGRRLVADIGAGVTWFWRQPFIRTTSLLVTGSDFTLNALYLVVIVLAQERGASPALVGAMFAFLGVGGLLGALAAPSLARRMSTRGVVVVTQWTVALLVPLLVVVPGKIAPGLLYGAMFFLHPTWNATVGAHRLRLAPDELRGRVSSVAALLSLGPVPFAALIAGFLLESVGSTSTVLALAGVMVVVALASFVSRSVREAPSTLPLEPIAPPAPVQDSALTLPDP